MNNLVPLPVSRVAIQRVDMGLDSAAMTRFLLHREVWFETDYVVFRRGQDCAVARIEKKPPSNSFCRVTRVEILSQMEGTRWIDDPAVDTTNPSALAERARASRIRDFETLVVNGLYELVNFIHRPQPLLVDVFDLSPPEPPRLLDMVRRVLAHRDFPPVVVNAHVQSILALARHGVDRPLLFPCGISALKQTVAASYLDEHPARQDWVLIGCALSRQIHRHFYAEYCPCIELCPKHLCDASSGRWLIRCCMVERRVELAGNVAVVPWGAELSLIEEALRALLNVPQEE